MTDIKLIISEHLMKMHAQLVNYAISCEEIGKYHLLVRQMDHLQSVLAKIAISEDIDIKDKA